MSAKTFYSALTPTLYAVNMLNPYNPMVYMAIKIEFPVFPVIEEGKKEPPELTLDDFLGYVPAFYDHINDGVNSKLYGTFVVFRDIAVRIIDINIGFDIGVWKKLVSLYIAHEMQLVIRDMKDEANLTSMEGEVREKNYYIKDLEALEKKDFNIFLLTPYGWRFWEQYDAAINGAFRGNLRANRRL